MTAEIQTRFLYPDPFEPAGVVVELEEAAMVTVSLTDSAGVVVATPLRRTHLGKGSHQIVIGAYKEDEKGLYVRIIVEMAGQTISEVKKLR